MDELKYLIYCLFKSIHVGICVFPQTLHQVKATMIFADRALWRHKASGWIGVPTLSQLGGELLQAWDAHGVTELWLQHTSLPAAG